MYEFLRQDNLRVLNNLYEIDVNLDTAVLKINLFTPQQQKNIFDARLLAFAAAAAVALELPFDSKQPEQTKIKTKIYAIYSEYKAASQVPDKNQDLASKFKNEILQDYLNALARLIQEKKDIDFFSAKKLLLRSEPLASFSLLKPKEVQQVIEKDNEPKITFVEEPITSITKDQAEELLKLSTLDYDQASSLKNSSFLNKLNSTEAVFLKNWVDQNKTYIENKLSELNRINTNKKIFGINVNMFLKDGSTTIDSSKKFHALPAQEIAFNIYDLEVKKYIDDLSKGDIKHEIKDEINELNLLWGKLEIDEYKKKLLKEILLKKLKNKILANNNNCNNYFLTESEKKNLARLLTNLKEMELQTKPIELKSPIPPTLNKILPFLSNIRKIKTVIEQRSDKNQKPIIITSNYYPHSAINSGSSRQFGKKYQRHHGFVGDSIRENLPVEEAFEDFFTPWLKTSSRANINISPLFFEGTFFSPLFFDHLLREAPYDNNLSFLETNLEQSRKPSTAPDEQEPFIRLQSNSPVNRGRKLSPEKLSPKLNWQLLLTNYNVILTAAKLPTFPRLNENNVAGIENPLEKIITDNQKKRKIHKDEIKDFREKINTSINTKLKNIIDKNKIHSFKIGLSALVSWIKLNKSQPQNDKNNKNPALWKAALEILIIRGRGGVWTGGCKTSADRTAAVLSLTMAMEAFYVKHGHLPDFDNDIEFSQTMEIQAKILVEGLFLHYPGLFCHFGAFGINQSDGLSILKLIAKNPMYPEELREAIKKQLNSYTDSKPQPAVTPVFFESSRTRKPKLPLSEKIQSYFAKSALIKTADKMLGWVSSLFKRSEKPMQLASSTKKSSLTIISEKLGITDSVTEIENTSGKHANGEDYYYFNHKTFKKMLPEFFENLQKYVNDVNKELNPSEAEGLQKLVREQGFYNIMDMLAFCGMSLRVKMFEFLVTHGNFNISSLGIDQVLLLIKLLPADNHKDFSNCNAYKNNFSLAHLNQILENSNNSYKKELLLKLEDKLINADFCGKDLNQYSILLMHLGQLINITLDKEKSKLIELAGVIELNLTSVIKKTSMEKESNVVDASHQPNPEGQEVTYTAA